MRKYFQKQFAPAFTQTSLFHKAVFLFACFFLLAGLEKASSACCTPFSLPNPITGLNQPMGMAINYGNGFFYLADSGNAALKTYDSNTGSLLNTLTTWTGGSFSLPNDVAVDSSTGNLYVSDATNGVVYEFNPQYYFIASIGGGTLTTPKGVYVEAQGVTTSLYVSDAGGNVYRFDSTTGGNNYPATPAATFGGSGVLGVPNGLWKTGNMVYVASDSGEVVGFDASSGYSSSVAYMNPSPLKTVRQDLAGNFYVTLYSGSVDTFPGSFSASPTNCTIMNHPWGVVVNSAGRILAGESSGGKVTGLKGCTIEPALTPTPTPCCQGKTLSNPISGLNQPLGMAIDYPNNFLYVTNSANATVKVFDSNTGAFLNNLTAWAGVSFVFPNDVAVDPSTSNFYVSDGANGVVYEFNSSASPILTIGAGALGFPRGVFVELQGTTTSLYVSVQSGYVYRFDSTDGGAHYPASPSATFGGAAVLGVPNGLVKWGNIVSVTNDSGQVVGFNSANGFNSTVQFSCTSALKSIRLDLGGNYYATETNGNVDKFVRSMSAAPAKCAIPNNPWGVAVNAAGNVFVNENTGAVSVLQGCVAEPQFTSTPTMTTTATATRTATRTPTATPGGPGGMAMAPVKGEATATFTPTPSATATPTALPPAFVVAAPNVSRNGQPVNFFVNLEQPGQITLELFDLTGEEVYRASLAGNTGLNTLQWPLENRSGNRVASGLYLYLLRVENGTGTSVKQGKVAVVR